MLMALFASAVIQTVTHPKPAVTGQTMQALTFLDRSTLAIGHSDGILLIWDCTAKREIHKVSIGDDCVHRVVCSSGEQAVFGQVGKFNIVRYDCKSKQVKNALKSSRTILDFALGPNNTCVCIETGNNLVVYDLKTGKQQAATSVSFKSSSATIGSLSLSSDGKLISVGASPITDVADPCILIWTYPDLGFKSLPNDKQRVDAIRFLPNKPTSLVFSSNDARITFATIEKDKLVFKSARTDSRILGIYTPSQSDCLVFYSLGGAISVLQQNRIRQIGLFLDPPNTMYDIAVSPDSSLVGVVTGGKNPGLHLIRIPEVK